MPSSSRARMKSTSLALESLNSLYYTVAPATQLIRAIVILIMKNNLTLLATALTLGRASNIKIL